MHRHRYSLGSWDQRTNVWSVRYILEFGLFHSFTHVRILEISKFMIKCIFFVKWKNSWKQIFVLFTWRTANSNWAECGSLEARMKFTTWSWVCWEISLPFIIITWSPSFKRGRHLKKNYKNILFQNKLKTYIIRHFKKNLLVSWSVGANSGNNNWHFLINTAFDIKTKTSMFIWIYRN